jgi:hypothetical protein
MSYHEQGIQSLSKPQISKLLNGHKVRVKLGTHTMLHVSPEQAKKIHKAHLKGGAVTIQLDPYSMNLNHHLRGGSAWTQLGRNTSNNLGVLSNAGTNYLVDKMGGDSSTPTAGSGMRHRGRPRKHHMTGGSAWTQLGRNTSNNLGVLSNAGTNYLVGQMGGDSSTPTAGSGIRRRGRPRKQNLHDLNTMMHIHGGAINRINKAGRWEHFANASLRDAIDTAGKAARVYYDSTGPMAQLGMGLKKHRGRPRKHGGALMAAGY